MNVRCYGAAPYRVAVVHGGPGAPGSVAALARGISEKHGVLEPLQSKCGIDDLVEELQRQLRENCEDAVALIGHSWGAWLCGLAAARQPELVRKLILVGCGPLDVKYIPEIGARRERNMTPEEYTEYKALLSALSDPALSDREQRLARLGAIAEKADGFDEIEDGAMPGDALPVNGAMYAPVMAEALALRESGRMLEEFRRIRCPMVLLQGAADSHPHLGVTEPLAARGVPIRAHILEKCGHTPWRERQAKDSFYEILFSELE